MKYRSDIDGLRGVAVIAVLLYHLGLLLSGGYLGVDVFFVISGYLITKIIYGEFSKGEFSIASFYERRARRILPVLFTVIAVSIIASYFLMLPSTFKKFSASAFAGILFSSNIYFWNSANYFHRFLADKPLLHTWSLGVEEQFYFLFPLFFLLASRYSKKFIQVLLAFAGSASFFLFVYLLEASNYAAFYLPTSRAWAFILGALLALDALPALKSRMLAELAGLLGLSCIAYAFQQTPVRTYSGLHALAPTVGAALIIYSGNYRTLCYRFLSFKPLVGAGLVSYSLYMWHWPIHCFYELYYLEPPKMHWMEFISLILVVSIVSWKYIELPFRDRTLLPKRASVFKFTAASILALALVSKLGSVGGLPRMVDRTIAKIDANMISEGKIEHRSPKCFLNSRLPKLSDFSFSECLARSTDKPNVLLMGDSHAAMYWKGFAELNPNWNVMQGTSSGCTPTITPTGRQRCLDLMRVLFKKEIQKGSIQAVILSGRWVKSDIRRIVETVRFLKNKVERVFVIGPIVEYQYELPLILAKHWTDTNAIKAYQLDYFRAIDKSLGRALKEEDAIYLSNYQAICEGSTCRTLTDEGTPLQFDYGHLTLQGAKFVIGFWMSTGLIDSEMAIL